MVVNGGKCETRYYDIYRKELELGKEILINMKLVFGF